VDYEPHLNSFYRGCGFRPTAAGLIHLAATAAQQADAGDGGPGMVSE
jgi:hypothetical protein